MSTDLETIAMLRDSAARYADDNYSFHDRWAVLDAPEGYSRKAWGDLAELGLLALRLPEDDGGLDGDAVAVGAVMEIAGSRLLMEPLFASAVVATGLLLKQGSSAQKAALLPQLADGSLILAFADEDAASDPCVLEGERLTGTKVGVLQGDVAGKLLVSARDATSGEPAVVMVDADEIGVMRREYRLVDGRGAALVSFDGVRVERLQPESGESAAAALADIRDEAAVALCAESLGIVNSVMTVTTEYLKVRKQFGRPIGANQALQHRLVDCFLLQEEVRALTAAAQQALAGPAEERARVVSGARAYVIQAARKVCNEAVQMHGGVGVTDELDVSHYFRRLMTNAALFGNRDAQFVRFVDAALAA
ncbi:MAG: acyl-CoA dehydrogenase family protein [Aromatoleum sp.]|jgi:alkylation response protein AidB-like acyl-CoA dehydrogenase|uniref:acyl-CoA dehydrogenase family protein n=1 Tax=Aromatoleum sp. TaxID=2307007 RepID=UPI00289411D5|nr:acyl-CoA dehydrogenase family protein [Aromatoleum sp.]MDT3670989.1 acyl-CoA dehydrogenase family protein [Aromatoleum sp.]